MEFVDFIINPILVLIGLGCSFIIQLFAVD